MIQEVKEFPRIDVLADIVIESRDKKFIAVTFNISRSGICFVSSKKLSVGDRCSVHLKKNRNLFSEKGTVRWNKFVDAQQEMIKYGLEFKAPLDQDKIDLFIKCCN